MTKRLKIEDYKKVLAVEGYSDLLFYAEVLEHLGKKPAKADKTPEEDEVFIKHFNGASDLTLKLETFLSPALLAEKSDIGIIVDADDNAAAKIQSIADTLKKVSGRSLEHGVWSGGQPNLGFFVVPDGHQDGEVETLAWNAWANDPQNRSPRQCIDDYLKCMKNLNRIATSPDKGRISALLAVMHDEDPRLGPGARSNVFSFARPEFTGLREFLDQM